MLTQRSPLPTLQLPQPPTDTVSSLEWFPLTQDGRTLLACSSWDKTVRVWDVAQAPNLTMTPQAQPKALFNLQSPVLCTAWAKNGVLFTGECGGGAARMINLQTQQQQQVGQHDAPVSGITFSEEKNILVTSSWDKTLRFWDLRQSSPILTKSLPGKCYGIGLRNNVLCAVTTNKSVLVYNMNDPNGNPKTFESPLRMPGKFISVAHDARACLVGSCEGRACIFFLGGHPPGHVKPYFPFKACRMELEEASVKPRKVRVFSVNAGCFHPTEKAVVVTAGGTGTFTAWNYPERSRVYDSAVLGSPITAINFDEGGRMFAYALGYDWHQGCHMADSSQWPLSVNVGTVTSDFVRGNSVGANRLL